MALALGSLKRGGGGGEHGKKEAREEMPRTGRPASKGQQRTPSLPPGDRQPICLGGGG